MRGTGRSGGELTNELIIFMAKSYPQPPLDGTVKKLKINI